MFDLSWLRRCAPNCILTFMGREMRLTVVRPLAAGEELCHSYTDLTIPTARRSELLRARYGFECDCIRCCAADAAVQDASSDAYHAACRALDDASSDGDYDAALLASRRVVRALEAGLAHVPLHPLLAVHRMRLAELEAEFGDESIAMRLLKATVAALSVTHVGGHALRAEASMRLKELHELFEENGIEDDKPAPPRQPPPTQPSPMQPTAQAKQPMTDVQPLLPSALAQQPAQAPRVLPAQTPSPGHPQPQPRPSSADASGPASDGTPLLVPISLRLLPSLMPPKNDAARWEALRAIGLGRCPGREGPLERMEAFDMSPQELIQYADPAGREVRAI